MHDHCGNVALNIGDRRWDNVKAMLRQCCVNIVATSLSMLGTDSETTFRLSTLGTDVETMFRQRCMNVVAMTLSILGTDIETTFVA